MSRKSGHAIKPFDMENFLALVKERGSIKKVGNGKIKEYHLDGIIYSNTEGYIASYDCNYDDLKGEFKIDKTGLNNMKKHTNLGHVEVAEAMGKSMGNYSNFTRKNIGVNQFSQLRYGIYTALKLKTDGRLFLAMPLETFVLTRIDPKE